MIGSYLSDLFVDGSCALCGGLGITGSGHGLVFLLGRFDHSHTITKVGSLIKLGEEIWLKLSTTSVISGAHDVCCVLVVVSISLSILIVVDGFL